MNEPVLVLNANFEPINVCSTRRAIGLILSGKAAMVTNGRGYIRTIRELFPRPSVIRLDYMIHRPRPHVKLTRREIFRRLGGKHIWSNVVTACPDCNHKKGGRRVEDAHMQPLHAPNEPPANAVYLYGKHLDENKEWEQYVMGW
jgi:5-methylcytosine-specific restriction endonuclease McrA